MQDNARIARELYECFNRRDLDGAVSYLANDAEWHDIASGHTFRGHDGFKQYDQMWLTGFPDAKCEVTNVICSGDWCTVEFTGKGTHTGTLSGPSGQIPPSGKRVEVKFCDVLQFKNGKIHRGRSYFDMMTMLNQLGMMPKARQAGQ